MTFRDLIDHQRRRSSFADAFFIRSACSAFKIKIKIHTLDESQNSKIQAKNLNVILPWKETEIGGTLDLLYDQHAAHYDRVL